MLHSLTADAFAQNLHHAFGLITQHSGTRAADSEDVRLDDLLELVRRHRVQRRGLFIFAGIWETPSPGNAV